MKIILYTILILSVISCSSSIPKQKIKIAPKKKIETKSVKKKDPFNVAFIEVPGVPWMICINAYGLVKGKTFSAMNCISRIPPYSLNPK